MRAFLPLWFGQTVSYIGSQITATALALWLFERTGQATSLALVTISSALPQIVLILAAGMIVDRFNRKRLMLICDALAAMITAVFLVLAATETLQAWHLYVGAASLGVVDRLQFLAYDTAITTMLDKRQYARAGGLITLMWYLGDLFATPLAAYLYGSLGLVGIMIIDLITFTAAVATTIPARIPQPERVTSSGSASAGAETTGTLKPLLTDLAFGFRALWQHRPLRALIMIHTLFGFSHEFTWVLYTPMILARTGSDPDALAGWTLAMGMAGGVAAIWVSTRGIPKNTLRVYGWSSVGAGIGKTLIGFGRSVPGWMGTQAFTSANFPFRGSAYSSILRSKIAPGAQGRAFAANSVLVQCMVVVGASLSAPLADYVFEPAMREGGSLAPIFGGLFGTGPGAGMALLIVLVAPVMAVAGVLALTLRAVRQVEALPDAVTIEKPMRMLVDAPHTLEPEVEAV